MDLSILAIPFLMLSGIPQTIKLIKTQKSDDLSVVTYGFTFFGIGLILTGGTGTIFLANLTSFLIVGFNLFLILIFRYYGKNRRMRDTDAPR